MTDKADQLATCLTLQSRGHNLINRDHKCYSYINYFYRSPAHAIAIILGLPLRLL